MLIKINKINLSHNLAFFFFLFKKFIIKLDIYGVLFSNFSNLFFYKNQVKIPFYFLNFFSFFFLFFKFFSSLLFFDIFNYYFIKNPFFFFNIDLNLKLFLIKNNDFFFELNLKKKKEKTNLIKFENKNLDNFTKFVFIYKQFINKKVKKLSKKSFYFLNNLDIKNKLNILNNFFFKNYLKYYKKRNIRKNASIINFFDFKFILKYFFFFRKDVFFILKNLENKIIKNFFQINNYNFLLYYLKSNREEYRQKNINDKYLMNKFYFLNFFYNNNVYKQLNIINSFLFLRNSFIYSKIKKNVKMDYIYFQKFYIYSREIFYFFSSFVRIIMKSGQKKKSRKIISNFFIKLKKSKLSFFKILRLFILKVLPSCGMLLSIKGRRKKQVTFFSLFNRLKSVSVLSRWLKEACLKKKFKFFFDSIFIEILDTLLKKSYVFNKYTLNYFSVLDFAKIVGRKKRIKKVNKNFIINNYNKYNLNYRQKKHKVNYSNKIIHKKQEINKISAKLKYVYKQIALLKSKKIAKKKLVKLGASFKKLYGYFNKNKSDKIKYIKFFNRSESKLKRLKEKKRIKLKNFNLKITRRIRLRKVLRKFSAFYLKKFKDNKNKKLKLSFIKNYKKRVYKKFKRLPRKIFYNKIKKKKVKDSIKKVLKRSNIFFIFNILKNFEKFFLNLEERTKFNSIFLNMFSNKNSSIVERISKNFMKFNNMSLNFLDSNNLDLNFFLENSNYSFSLENFKLIFKNYILKKISSLKIKYLNNFDILKSISLKKFLNKNIYLNYYLLKKLDLLKYNFTSIYFNKYIWLNYILKKKGFLKRIEFSKIDALNLKNIIIRIYLYFYFVDYFYNNNLNNLNFLENKLNKINNNNVNLLLFKKDMSNIFYSDVFNNIYRLFNYTLSHYGNNGDTTYKSLSVSIFFYIINLFKESNFEYLFKKFLINNDLLNYLIKDKNIKLFFKNFKYFNFFSKINLKKNSKLFRNEGKEVDINYLNILYHDIKKLSKRLSDKLAYKGSFAYKFYINEIKNKNKILSFNYFLKNKIFKDRFTFHYYFLNFKLGLEKEIYEYIYIYLLKFFRIKFLNLILIEYKYKKKKKFKLNVLKVIDINNLKKKYYNIIFNKYFIITQLQKISFKNFHKKISNRSYFFMKIFKTIFLDLYLNINLNKTKEFFNIQYLNKILESIDFNLIKENINEKYFYSLVKNSKENYFFFNSNQFNKFNIIKTKVKEKILLNMNKNTKENFLFKKNKVSLFNFKNKSNTLRKYRYILDGYLEHILNFKIKKENINNFDFNLKYSKNIISFFLFIKSKLFFFKFIDINKLTKKFKLKKSNINKSLKKKYKEEIKKEKKINKKKKIRKKKNIKNSLLNKINEDFENNKFKKRLFFYLNNLYLNKDFLNKKNSKKKDIFKLTFSLLDNRKSQFLYKNFYYYYLKETNNLLFLIYFNKLNRYKNLEKKDLFYKSIKTNYKFINNKKF